MFERGCACGGVSGEMRGVLGRRRSRTALERDAGMRVAGGQVVGASGPLGCLGMGYIRGGGFFFAGEEVEFHGGVVAGGFFVEEFADLVAFAIAGDDGGLPWELGVFGFGDFDIPSGHVITPDS